MLMQWNLLLSVFKHYNNRIQNVNRFIICLRLRAQCTSRLCLSCVCVYIVLCCPVYLINHLRKLSCSKSHYFVQTHRLSTNKKKARLSERLLFFFILSVTLLFIEFVLFCARWVRVCALMRVRMFVYTLVFLCFSLSLSRLLLILKSKTNFSDRSSNNNNNNNSNERNTRKHTQRTSKGHLHINTMCRCDIILVYSFGFPSLLLLSFSFFQTMIHVNWLWFGWKRWLQITNIVDALN